MAALEPGRTSWTLPLDAVRLGPADDATEVTAAQIREVAERIIAAGHWRDGDPDIEPPRSATSTQPSGDLRRYFREAH